MLAVLIRLESVLSSVTTRKLGPKPFRPLSNFFPPVPETTNFCTRYYEVRYPKTRRTAPDTTNLFGGT
jgi:hypothetical protein